MPDEDFKTQDSGYFGSCFTAHEEDLSQSHCENGMETFNDSVVESSDLQEKATEVTELAMMPTNKEVYSYSYKSIDYIHNFWAGPSYWKFFEPRDTKKIISTNRVKLSNEVTVESLLHIKDNLDTETNSKRFRRFKSQLTLPRDYHIDPNILDVRIFPTADNIFHSTANFEEMDDENLHLFNATIDDKNSEEMQQLQPQSLSFPTFQSRKRVADMKMIKETCFKIIKAEASINASKDAKFSDIAKKSKKILLEKDESTSTAVIFQAILHLTSERNVAITSKNNYDFNLLLR